ncbi:hypothetical protein D3C71_1176400 [compost metagenome]
MWQDIMLSAICRRSFTAPMSVVSLICTGKPAACMCSAQPPQQPQLGSLNTFTNGSACLAAAAATSATAAVVALAVAFTAELAGVALQALISKVLPASAKP